MTKSFCTIVWAVLLATFCVSTRASADLSQPAIQSLYDRVSKSLVVVQYVWDSELGPHEISLPGIVVDDRGLVMTSAALFDPRIPEAQMKEFKVLRPVEGQEPAELPATFQGRDDRSGMAYVRVTDPKDLVPLKFVHHDAVIGEKVYSVGLMPESEGFKAYFTSANVAVVTRGERFAALVDGKVAGAGSPVIDESGAGIGFVGFIPPPPASGGQTGRSGQESNPNSTGDSFTPSSEFFDYLQSPPTGSDIDTPWLGIFEMGGLKKKEADYYGLKQPGIQVIALAQGGPAEKAGLQQGQIIVAMNGKPLQRADAVAQLPLMIRREVRDMHPGAQVTFSVLTDKDLPPKDVTITLDPAPPSLAKAKRWWNAEFGFGVRDVVLFDRFTQHLTPTDTGVVVSLTKPNGPASTAHVQSNTLISKLNGNPVASVSDFGKQFAQSLDAHPHDPVILLVSHGGQDETLRMEPPQ